MVANANQNQPVGTNDNQSLWERTRKGNSSEKTLKTLAKFEVMLNGKSL